MKKVKYLATLLFMIFVSGQNVSAQKLNNFYIEPTLSYKIHHPGAAFGPPPISTHYFSIESKKIIYPANFFNLFPGVNVGYSFNNNDKLSIGLNADASATGFEFTSLSHVAGTNLPTNSFSSGLHYYFGSLFTNFTLSYKRNIFLINSKIHPGRFVRGFVNLGLNYAYRPSYSNFKDEKGARYVAADSTQITIGAYASSSGPIGYRVAFKSYIGMDFTFGKNNTEWFSLNCGYAFSSHTAYSGVAVKIDVTGKTTNEHYLYPVSGSGNAFYVTFSRRIHPFIYHRRNSQRTD